MLNLNMLRFCLLSFCYSPINLSMYTFKYKADFGGFMTVLQPIV